MIFEDRREAGRLLAENLKAYSRKKDALILALPRGGIPVGLEVAKKLHLPLDIFLVRKLGMPGHEEYAIGAIAHGGIIVWNQEAVGFFIPENLKAKIIAKEKIELERRNKLYRQGKPPPKVKNRTVILVDDGLATGSTMRAAIKALRLENAGRIIVAVPVAPPDIYKTLPEADEVICLETPAAFHGVGQWYENFSQISDKQVKRMLADVLEEKN